MQKAGIKPQRIIKYTEVRRLVGDRNAEDIRKELKRMERRRRRRAGGGESSASERDLEKVKLSMKRKWEEVEY
jgi:hypothetical protein